MRLRAKILLLCVLMGGALVSGGAAAKSFGSTDSALPPKSVAESTDENAAYWLYDSGGFIAVCGDNEFELTDIETQTLNEHDRELLRDGIPAKDRDELLSLLEDLSS